MADTRFLFLAAESAQIAARGIAQPDRTGEFKGQDVEPCERCGLFVPVGKTCRCDAQSATAAVAEAIEKAVR